MAAVLIIAGGLLGAVAAGLFDYRAGLLVFAGELVVAGVDMARDLPVKASEEEGEPDRQLRAVGDR